MLPSTENSRKLVLGFQPLIDEDGNVFEPKNAVEEPAWILPTDNPWKNPNNDTLVYKANQDGQGGEFVGFDVQPTRVAVEVKECWTPESSQQLQNMVFTKEVTQKFCSPIPPVVFTNPPPPPPPPPPSTAYNSNSRRRISQGINSLTTARLNGRQMTSQVEKAANTFSRRLLSSAMLARTPLGLKFQQQKQKEQEQEQQQQQRPFDTDSIMSESSVESEGPEQQQQIDNVQGRHSEQFSNRSASSSANSTTRITQVSAKRSSKKKCRTFCGIPPKTFMSIFLIGFGCGALSVIVFVLSLAATLPDELVPISKGDSDNPKAAGLIGQQKSISKYNSTKGGGNVDLALKGGSSSFLPLPPTGSSSTAAGSLPGESGGGTSQSTSRGNVTLAATETDNLNEPTENSSMATLGGSPSSGATPPGDTDNSSTTPKTLPPVTEEITKAAETSSPSVSSHQEEETGEAPPTGESGNPATELFGGEKAGNSQNFTGEAGDEGVLEESRAEASTALYRDNHTDSDSEHNQKEEEESESLIGVNGTSSNGSGYTPSPAEGKEIEEGSAQGEDPEEHEMSSDDSLKASEPSHTSSAYIPNYSGDPKKAEETVATTSPAPFDDDDRLAETQSSNSSMSASNEPAWSKATTTSAPLSSSVESLAPEETSAADLSTAADQKLPTEVSSSTTSYTSESLVDEYNQTENGIPEEVELQKATEILDSSSSEIMAPSTPSGMTTLPTVTVNEIPSKENDPQPNPPTELISTPAVNPETSSTPLSFTTTTEGSEIQKPPSGRKSPRMIHPDKETIPSVSPSSESNSPTTNDLLVESTSRSPPSPPNKRSPPLTSAADDPKGKKKKKSLSWWEKLWKLAQVTHDHLKKVNPLKNVT